MTLDTYLTPTPAIDSDHPQVRRFTQVSVEGIEGVREQAVAIYYAVRDGIRYDPYRIATRLESARASATLANGYGYCVSKAVLMAAMGRVLNIPTRLGFADVRNHLTSDKLREVMGSDLFAWHGYVELWIEGRWVKATPAFNLSLCEKTGVKPLEFDGRTDSIFHPFDASGQRHMEYVTDHGQYADLPLALLLKEYERHYPGIMPELERTGGIEGDFEAEARADIS
ncbi:transglutaminase-like domain-containing protein [Aestuariirhabdus litorea]|uniref:Transglutaminase domain-containing protein n=1 Tax=Aestuariirhabdus litorea TaxID=2528527 RepID=A0A3P3VRW4_9GAMM|nr:transglutaminase family protein [Aestuariirhabdus litorea]RRJ84436.1 transglutaminase domain-containing protein [Aestuariirhabdus litorea]RWW97660.1 transglutaminase domain-containing protein [Endozoicomonadaceae bacterium GTF-13]